jgi:hypothetical protein
MVRVLKSLPVNLVSDPSLPVSLFDPKWNDPAVAAKVALELARSLPRPGKDPLVDVTALPVQKKTASEERTFVFQAPLTFGANAVKAGSFGELHRRYTYGGGRPPANFHAQAVAFAVFDDGRYFLRAKVGCHDGSFGNTCTLTLKLFAGDTPLGGTSFSATLDPGKDVDAAVTGSDPQIAARFVDVDRAVVVFSATPGSF